MSEGRRPSLTLRASEPAENFRARAFLAVAARKLTLNSVRVGDVTVYNVEAMVVPQSMPVVLLGNTFLSHFQMHSDSSSLVLDKKN